MKKITFLFIITCVPFLSFAQSTALKTNLLSDASLSFNAGVEYAIADQWTIDFFGSYNPWTFSENRKWKHVMLQPEVRYWPCQKYYRWFFGTHSQAGAYNIGGVPLASAQNSRFEGWFVGWGIGFGYQLILSRKLNLEWELGGGYNYTRYNQYRCPHCGNKIASDVPYHYFGITKAQVGLVYLF